MTTNSKLVDCESQHQNQLQAFSSLSVINCYGCGVTIREKEVFSRSSDKLGSKPGIMYVWCGNCRPINLESSSK